MGGRARTWKWRPLKWLAVVVMACMDGTFAAADFGDPRVAGGELGLWTSLSANSRTTSGSRCRGNTSPGRPCGSSPGSARERRLCCPQGNPLHRSIPGYHLEAAQVVQGSSLQAWVAAWCRCSSHQVAPADPPKSSTLLAARHQADQWVHKLTLALHNPERLD